MREGKNSGLITVGVTEGSSLIGLDKASWGALGMEEQYKLRKKAREAFFNAGADYVIDSLDEVPILIEGLAQKK